MLGMEILGEEAYGVFLFMNSSEKADYNIVNKPVEDCF